MRSHGPVCRHIGARHIVITDVNKYRLNLAKQVGATMAIDVSEGENSTDVVRDAMAQLGTFAVAAAAAGPRPSMACLRRSHPHAAPSPAQA